MVTRLKTTTKNCLSVYEFLYKNIEATYFDSEEPDFYDDPFGDEEDGVASYELQEETANNVVSEPLVVKRGKSLSIKDLEVPKKRGRKKSK